MTTGKQVETQVADDGDKTKEGKVAEVLPPGAGLGQSTVADVKAVSGTVTEVQAGNKLSTAIDKLKSGGVQMAEVVPAADTPEARRIERDKAQQEAVRTADGILTAFKGNDISKTADLFKTAGNAVRDDRARNNALGNELKNRFSDEGINIEFEKGYVKLTRPGVDQGLRIPTRDDGKVEVTDAKSADRPGQGTPESALSRILNPDVKSPDYAERLSQEIVKAVSKGSGSIFNLGGNVADIGTVLQSAYNSGLTVDGKELIGNEALTAVVRRANQILERQGARLDLSPTDHVRDNLRSWDYKLTSREGELGTGFQIKEDPKIEAKTGDTRPPMETLSILYSFNRALEDKNGGKERLDQVTKEIAKSLEAAYKDAPGTAAQKMEALTQKYSEMNQKWRVGYGIDAVRNQTGDISVQLVKLGDSQSKETPIKHPIWGYVGEVGNQLKLNLKAGDNAKAEPLEQSPPTITKPERTIKAIGDDITKALTDQTDLKDLHKELSNSMLYAYQNAKGSPEDKFKEVKNITAALDKIMPDPYGVTAEMKDGKMTVAIAEASLRQDPFHPRKSDVTTADGRPLYVHDYYSGSFKLPTDKPADAMKEPATEIIKKPEKTPFEIADEITSLFNQPGDDNKFNSVHRDLSNALLFAYQDTQGSPEQKFKAVKDLASQIDGLAKDPYGVLAEMKDGKLNVSIVEGSLRQSSEFPHRHPNSSDQQPTYYKEHFKGSFDLPKDSSSAAELLEKQAKSLVTGFDGVRKYVDSTGRVPVERGYLLDQLEFMARRAHMQKGPQGVQELNEVLSKAAAGGKAPQVVLNSDGKTMNIVSPDKAPARSNIPIEAPEKKAERTANFNADDKFIKTTQYPQDILAHAAFTADPEFATAKWQAANRGQEDVINSIYRKDLEKVQAELPPGVLQGFAGTIPEVNNDLEKNGMGRPLEEGDPNAKAIAGLFRLKRQWNTKARNSADIEVADPKTGDKTKHKAFDLDGTKIFKVEGKEVIQLYKSEGFSVMIIPDKDPPIGKVGKDLANDLVAKAEKSAPIEDSATVRLAKVQLDIKEQLDWLSKMSEDPKARADFLRLQQAVMVTKLDMDQSGFDARQAIAASASRGAGEIPPQPKRIIDTGYTMVITYNGTPLFNMPVTKKYFKDPKAGK